MIGRNIGHYQICARLGESGVGVLYEARDLKRGTAVIVKFLPSDLIGTSAAKDKLEADLRLAVELEHPNVCRALEFGVTDSGEPFVVTELFSGITLDQELSSGTLEPLRAIQLASQLCDGLEAGHRLGIVHRDVTPANLLLVEDTIKILDFGFAGLDREASLTLTGTVAGSVAYLAPEQLEGAQLSEGTDIWAVGLLLFELTTGERPFERFSLPTTFEAILAGAVPGLTELCPSAPAGLEEIIATCLSKSPSDRYETVGALGAALRAL